MFGDHDLVDRVPKSVENVAQEIRADFGDRETGNPKIFDRYSSAVACSGVCSAYTITSALECMAVCRVHGSAMSLPCVFCWTRAKIKK